MKLSKQHRQNSIVMNMTPMIDIIMMLIIFFMVFWQIPENKRDPSIALTQVQAGGEQQQPSQLVVNVNQHGEIVVVGRTMPFGEFVIKLGEELQKVGNEPANLTVVIRGDRRATSRTVNRVVKQLEALGIEKVQIGVEVSK